MTPSSGHVVIERDGAIAIVRLARPDKLNALSIAMLRDLQHAIAAPGDAAAIVVTGTGRAFSAGDDLVATDSFGEADFVTLMTSFQNLTRVVLGGSIPVVAALNGIAVGGAAELALCCDARVGHPGADWLFPENGVGLTISNGSSLLLPRLLGPRALPLVLDGERIPGTRARELGLLDYFVDDAAEVVPQAIAVARRWVERGLATPYHLRLLRPPIAEVEAALVRETAIGVEAWRSGVAAEGIRRYLARKSPR